MKGGAYALSGSGLIRCAAFESMGDVVNSTIMWVTQAKVESSQDGHLYPVGKARLTPLGVLFFCAFMASTMLSVAIESLQTLLEPAQDNEGTHTVLRRMFSERPHLRGTVNQEQLEGIIAEYGGEGDAGEGAGHDRLLLFLLVACVVVKAVCLVACKSIEKKANSSIAKTLALDHRNDVLSNSLVIVLIFLVKFLETTSIGGPWLAKLDPAASLLMSVWIIWGWLSEAFENVTKLSNRSADDEDVQIITTAANQFLEGGQLRLCGCNVYHAGEGYEVRLDVCPKQGKSDSSAQIMKSLEDLEEAVQRLNCETDVLEVHARLREGKDMSWAKEYPVSSGSMGPAV